MNSSKAVRTDFFGYWLRLFLGEHLIVTRNLTRNTQTSYRDSLRLLVRYASNKLGIPTDRLKVNDISKDLVLNFLDEYIEQTRKSIVSSRNQRLAAIKSFAKFLAWESPEHIDWSSQIRLIPLKKSEQKQITYMDKQEIEALTEAPLNVPNNKLSERDHVIILFLYNTGARVSEAINVRVKDIVMPKKKGMGMVTLHGKGRHERTCPLWEDFWDLLRPFMQDKTPDDYLFLNRLNKPMTRHCIYYLIKKYSANIFDIYPNLKDKRPSPHTIRHTTATHLLNAGTDIDTVRSWLGHSSIDTTNVYAEISMEKKLEALKKCETPDTDVPQRKWGADDTLMAFLDSL